MKKQTINSLITILIFNSAILISAKAQIVYHDIIPDVTHTCIGGSLGSPCSQTYNLDLNNDGITDYFIESYHSLMPGGSNVSYVRIYPQGINQFASTSLNTVKKLSQFDSIGVSLIWHASTWQYFKFVWSTSQGDWNNEVNKYIGLKLIVGGQIYYGWARLNVNVVSASATFTIKDYAYNSIPNQPILAGGCPTPTATLIPSGFVKICQGDNVTLTANGTGSQYQWKKNGVNINGATQQTYVAKTAGTYKVLVTNSCGSQTSNSAIVTVGLPCKNSDASLSMTSDGLEQISIYPNPATNSVTIKIPSNEAGEIRVMNLLGETLTGFKTLSGLNEAKIDVSDFPAGMYMIRWNSGENYQTEKFSVMH